MNAIFTIYLFGRYTRINLTQIPVHEREEQLEALMPFIARDLPVWCAM